MNIRAVFDAGSAAYASVRIEFFRSLLKMLSDEAREILRVEWAKISALAEAKKLKDWLSNPKSNGRPRWATNSRATGSASLNRCKLCRTCPRNSIASNRLDCLASKASAHCSANL